MLHVRWRQMKVKYLWEYAVYEDGGILPPCGRCREFIAQIDDRNMETKTVLPEMKEGPLKDLLPERWDSKWD